MAAFVPLPAVAQESLFRRGDGNGDGLVDTADSVSLLLSVFGTAPRDCADALDVNDDGRINVGDPVSILRHLFRGAPPPPAPSGDCGVDPSEDALLCDSYPPCAPDPAACLSDELLGETLGEIPGLGLCLPPDFLEVPLTDGLSVRVCPEEAAPACGEGGSPGCAVEISSITPFVDIERQRLGLHLEGRVDDLPIDVDGGILSATCLNDIGGTAADSPFSLDVVFPLATREIEPGIFEIEGVDEAVVDNVDMVLESSGGIVCTLLAAGQDLFLDLFLAPLETALRDLGAQLPDAVVGLRLCP